MIEISGNYVTKSSKELPYRRFISGRMISFVYIFQLFIYSTFFLQSTNFESEYN